MKSMGYRQHGRSSAIVRAYIRIHRVPRGGLRQGNVFCVKSADGGSYLLTAASIPVAPIAMGTILVSRVRNRAGIANSLASASTSILAFVATRAGL
jgi:hypothetical protein